MRPRKAKELVPGVASELDLPPKLVEDVVNFYWAEAWNSLTNPRDIKVHIACLGDFNIKHWRLQYEQDKIVKLKQGSRQIVNNKLDEKSEILSNLQYRVQEENQRKEFIYNHKKNEDLEE